VQLIPSQVCLQKCSVHPLGSLTGLSGLAGPQLGCQSPLPAPSPPPLQFSSLGKCVPVGNWVSSQILPLPLLTQLIHEQMLSLSSPKCM
jgi:hypothetical protein